MLRLSQLGYMNRNGTIHLPQIENVECTMGYFMQEQEPIERGLVPMQMHAKCCTHCHVVVKGPPFSKTK